MGQLEDLLRYRMEQALYHDYGELVALDTSIVEETLANARIFVESIESYLHSLGHLVTK